MAEAAKKAVAEAAERGDRQGSRDGTSDRKGSARAQSGGEDRSKSLRAFRDEPTAKKNGAHAATASEALQDLHSSSRRILGKISEGLAGTR